MVTPKLYPVLHPRPRFSPPLKLFFPHTQAYTNAPFDKMWILLAGWISGRATSVAPVVPFLQSEPSKQGFVCWRDVYMLAGDGFIPHGEFLI